MNILDQFHSNRFSAYHADCVELSKLLPNDSIDYCVFSPPFSSLYTYSNSERDMGNSKMMMSFGFILNS